VTPAPLVSGVDKGIDCGLEISHYLAGADVGNDATRRVGECALRVYTFPKDDQVETAAGCPNPDVAVGHMGVLALIRSVILTAALLLLHAGRTAAARSGWTWLLRCSGGAAFIQSAVAPAVGPGSAAARALGNPRRQSMGQPAIILTLPVLSHSLAHFNCDCGKVPSCGWGQKNTCGRPGGHSRGSGRYFPVADLRTVVA
jgi:hypothetical protein